MRITLPKHHDQYLRAIASQMGTTTQEALNYLLWELRKSNYQFGSQFPQQPIQQRFDPSTFEAQEAIGFQPSFPDAVREYERIQEEIDPIIARMALLVDDF